ncbi:MAG: hypothetical protein FOGNACKC_06213 [Anaerolineae bacterium]|nr:hypothetical protein [Anaerolineae bacterium]
MGEGGGYYQRNAVDMHSLIQNSVSQTEENIFQTKVEDVLQDALGDFNKRDAPVIRQHLETIKYALTQNIEGIEGVVDLMFGGSTQKHTYVDGLSDVDVLACLNDTSLANKSPREAIQSFANALQQRLPRTEIKAGRLAVTVKFSDGYEIQVLPAIRTAQGFRIAQSNGEQWSNVVAPQRFAQKLTKVNRQLNNKVVPVIKLAKAINEGLPKPARLSGYHIESLAIEAFKNYDGRVTYREMLKHFWVEAQTRVLTPIKDNTGQSVHVDDYLGSANSITRQRASQAIKDLNRRINNADSTRSVDKWKEMLEL